MTDPSVNVPETAPRPARTPPHSTNTPSTTGVGAGLRSLGARQCPGCGAYVSAHTSVCPECGESMQRRPKKIRCMRCGGQASSELTICPHCGRELRPAPPRLLTWGVPAGLVALFLFIFITEWDNGNPLVWARDQLRAGFTVVGERIEPEIVLAVTPIAPDRDTGPNEGPGAALAIESAYRAQAALGQAEPAPNEASGGEGAPEEGGEAAAMAALPEATPTEPPTATPEPTATETPIPTETPTPEPTATPEPVVVEYTVNRGDTLVTIAARHGVDVEELMAANNIGERDVFVIQPGQVLVIPLTPTPTSELPTATPAPTETPTPQAIAAPTATVAPNALRLDAPVLLRPEDGARLSCDEVSALAWQRVPRARDSDKYILHLGFVNGRSADGDEQIVWILAQQQPITRTEWELDASLCGLASAQNDHQWRWWVEVVGDSEGRQVQVSPPSETWGFTWE